MLDIRYEPEELILKIPKKLATAGYVQEFLERIRLDVILSRSQATDEAIRDLAKQVDTNWWNENRDRFLVGDRD